MIRQIVLIIHYQEIMKTFSSLHGMIDITLKLIMSLVITFKPVN